MKDLFDWKRVEQEVRVITPEFQVWKAGQPKTVVIYAKMCRGEMTRFIVKNRLECPEELKSFSWEGFVWDEIRSTENVWHFFVRYIYVMKRYITFGSDVTICCFRCLRKMKN